MKTKRVVLSEPYSEAAMWLTQLVQDCGTIIAVGSGMSLILPGEMEQILRPLIGKKIDVLRTDIPGRQYLVRVISEVDEAHGGYTQSRSLWAEVVENDL